MNTVKGTAWGIDRGPVLNLSALAHGGGMIEFARLATAKRKENLMPFKKGQEVLIKNPGTLVGKVISQRSGDSGLPEEQTHYRVQIQPRYYLSGDLEPVEEDSSSPRLERGSGEWLEALGRFNEAGRQLLTDPQNNSLLANWGESGTKLGLLFLTE
jgi:hypothetical protein